MAPDIIFLLGVVIAVGAIPAAISSFSSSNGTMRPVIGCIVVGGGLIALAFFQTAGDGYSFSDVPRIAKDLFQ